jgi:O-antigen ligase
MIALFIFNIVMSSYIDSFNKVEKLIKFFVCATMLTIIKVFFFYGSLSGTPHSRILRITNRAITVNGLAHMIGFSIILLTYLFIKSKKRVYLFAIFFEFIPLFFFDSRMGLLISIIGIFLFLFFDKKITPKLLTIISTGALILILIIFTFNENFALQLKEMLLFFSTSELKDSNLISRKQFIATGFEIFKRYPILGIGLNNFRFYSELHNGIDLYSHNNYIEILSGLGIIGFIIYYWIFLRILFRLLIAYRKKVKSSELNLAITLTIALLLIQVGTVIYSGVMFSILLLLSFYISEIKNYPLLEFGNKRVE